MSFLSKSSLAGCGGGRSHCCAGLGVAAHIAMVVESLALQESGTLAKKIIKVAMAQVFGSVHVVLAACAG